MTEDFHSIETPSRVSYLFDQMAADYDQLRDLWYSWLFSRLHLMITENVLSRWNSKIRKRVLDIGCGTGFQSFLYALTGAEVIGVDISRELLEVGREKAVNFRKRFPCPLFPSYYPFVTEHDEKIANILRPRFSDVELLRPEFRFGDATHLDLPDSAFDHINCCGSTLSFIGDFAAVLGEMHRLLRPGGTYVMEVEAKYNLDLVWPCVDATLLRGRLGYEASAGEAFRDLFSGIRSNITVQYPFGEQGDPVYMDLRLFVKSTLTKEIERNGLSCDVFKSIHSLTNLIPSTLLDTPEPSPWLVRTFRALARVEQSLPFYIPGCSLVIFGSK
ncbi:MAG TPA: methyltransferase domain-containing protein [Terracidiphilus sp.]|jgi:ubiquinone/menaquinone biosynthesis C-methylase UbiE|nr:methyltransferase domain-containing protein [Terracidiphilus sp.]